MRAFLSHRKKGSDKPVVDKIAKILGRQNVIYDEFEFTNSDSFKDSIKKGIERASLFVIFISHNLLKFKEVGVDWVREEVLLAKELLAQGKIKKVAYYIIDDTEFQAIPKDLKQFIGEDVLIQSEKRAENIATDIERILNELRVDKKGGNIFVGRSDKIEELEDLINEESNPLVITGFSGMGRRTLLRKVANEYLSLHSFCEVLTKSEDRPSDILLKIQAKRGLIDTEELRKKLDHSDDLDQRKCCSEIVDIIQSIVNSGTLLIFNDDGAFANEDGFVHSDFEELFQKLSGEQDKVVGIVSKRRLKLSPNEPIKDIRISELNLKESITLLKGLFRQKNIIVSDNEIKNIARGAKGYPLDILYIPYQINSYGKDLILSEGTRLNARSRNYFEKELKRLKFSEAEKIILQTLSVYNPLPLAVLQAVLSEEESEVSSIADLIDKSFINPVNSLYFLPAPVQDSCYKAFEGMQAKHKVVAEALEEYLEKCLIDKENSEWLELSENLFKANGFAGRKGSNKEIAFLSTYGDMTEQFYHDRKYEKVIEYGCHIINYQLSNSVRILRYVSQSYSRLEKYDEAEEYIEKLKSISAYKDAYFAEGFMYRQKGDFDNAIEAYEQAINHGRRDVPIYRELAQCYSEKGLFKDAMDNIERADIISPDSEYVVSLKFQIAIKQNDEESASEAFKKLKPLSDDDFLYFRQSQLDVLHHDFVKALENARKAKEKMKGHHFQIASHFVKCLIRNGFLSDARKELKEIGEKWSHQKKDLQNLLHAELELADRSPKGAKEFLNKVKEPQRYSEYHKLYTMVSHQLSKDA